MCCKLYLNMSHTAAQTHRSIACPVISAMIPWTFTHKVANLWASVELRGNIWADTHGPRWTLQLFLLLWQLRKQNERLNSSEEDTETNQPPSHPAFNTLLLPHTHAHTLWRLTAHTGWVETRLHLQRNWNAETGSRWYQTLFNPNTLKQRNDIVRSLDEFQPTHTLFELRLKQSKERVWFVWPELLPAPQALLFPR